MDLSLTADVVEEWHLQRQEGKSPAGSPRARFTHGAWSHPGEMR
eukprot:gene22388-15306_t